MEWIENEEVTNDRCSTASSLSNSTDLNNVLSAHSNGPKSVSNQTTQNTKANSNTSLNLDSMSDGELSDFSLNDSDDDGKTYHQFCFMSKYHKSLLEEKH